MLSQCLICQYQQDHVLGYTLMVIGDAFFCINMIASSKGDYIFHKTAISPCNYTNHYIANVHISSYLQLN